MAEELDEIIKKEGEEPTNDDPEANPQQDGGRAGTRINSLLSKLSDTHRAKEAAEDRAFNAEFELGFGPMTSKYPLATEHKDEIKSAAKANKLSVEDATVMILNKHGKLTTAEELNRKKAEEGAQGGSADTVPPRPSGQKDPKDMTQDERLAALREAEAKGELGLS